MSSDKLKLWKIYAHVEGDQPEPYQRWKLTNGFSGSDTDTYERLFVILSEKPDDALLWVTSLLSDISHVSFSTPVQAQLDFIIHDVTDLKPLLQGD